MIRCTNLVVFLLFNHTNTYRLFIWLLFFAFGQPTQYHVTEKAQWTLPLPLGRPSDCTRATGKEEPAATPDR